MRLASHAFIMFFTFICLAPTISTAQDGGVELIKIGDLSSYSAGAAWSQTIKDGLAMALEEINEQGGINGKRLDLISRDDGGSPSEALRAADEMFLRDDILFLIGANFANTELALSDYAKRNKRLFISLVPNSDEFLWQGGHDYAYRVSGPALYALNRMFAEKAAARGKLKWAGISHNYAWGQSNHEAFKKSLKEFSPKVQFVSEQWPAVGKINAGAVVQAMLKQNPEAIYTALWGADLVEFLREGKKRGLFEGRLLVGDFFGRPEFLEQIGTELPEGIITLAIPHKDSAFAPDDVRNFAAIYEDKFGYRPRYISMLSYHSLHLIANVLKRSNTLDIDKIRETLERFEAESLFGTIKMRSIDNLADNGMWIGETAIENGKAVVKNVQYYKGANYMPSDEEIRRLRGEN